MITHVILMKFTDPADTTEAAERLQALTATVEHIRSMQVGADVVHSEVSYDLAMITTHRDVEDLGAYQQHPDHVAVGGWLRERLSSRHSVDFES